MTDLSRLFLVCPSGSLGHSEVCESFDDAVEAAKPLAVEFKRDVWIIPLAAIVTVKNDLKYTVQT